MTGKHKRIDLEKEKVSKIFWTYAIPSLVAVLAQNTAGLVDSAFIGRFVGPNGLSAITLVMPFVFLFGGVGTMLAIGGSTLAGIYKGKGEYEKSNNYFVVTISLIAIVSILGSIILFYTGDLIAEILKLSGEVAGFVNDYTGVLSVFILPFITSFAFLFFLKLDGKPAIAVATSVSGTVINVILNFLFIVVFNMKMIGAALATGLSQLIPCLIFLYLIITRSSWKFTKPKFLKKDILAMIFNGSSELLSMASTSIAGFVYNALIISKIGLDGVAAYSVAMQVANISTSISYGFAESCQSSISVNVGAKQFKRVKKLRQYAVYSNLIAGIFMAIVSVVFSKEIISVFTNKSNIIQLASFILLFYAMSFLLKGVNIALATYYTSVNSPLISCIIALSRSLVVFIIGLYLMPLIYGKNGIWIATIFAEFVTTIIALIYLKFYPYGSLKNIKNDIKAVKAS
ncbi:MATE family efflux transporter [Clostridium sp. 'deep sea']|uniref:MATE family efflux transporter n=1 Tax=Clostridium sp. 'deep sea' TaxID=2779445 RepID=UPI0018966AEA|nr:MATE family efflux transporter [Clostridium sp. 'deep sea']QOR35113.1 MATE family efflux transporter [Clostridium sp. 'deep sea']